MPPDYIYRGAKTQNENVQKGKSSSKKPVVSKVKALWSKPSASISKHRSTPYSVPYTAPKAKADVGSELKRSRIPVLKHPPVVKQKLQIVKPSAEETNHNKANTLPVRTNPNNTNLHVTRNRFASESLARPLWLPSGRLSPKSQPNSQARIPIRRRHQSKVTNESSSKQHVNKKTTKETADTRTSLSLKPIRRNFGNLAYKGRTPSYILATTKEPLQQVNKGDKVAKKPVVTPRRSLLREKPVPKPRRLAPKPTVDRNNNRVRNIVSESTWPRKSSPLLQKRARARKSERRYNKSDDFKPIWLPVGTLSRLKKNSVQDANVLKSKNLVNRKSIVQSKTGTKKTTNSIQKQSSIEKQKATTLPARIVKPPRSKWTNKSELKVSKPMWLPNGKLTTKPAPVIRDRLVDSNSMPRLQRSLSRRRSARYRKMVKEDSQSNYVNVTDLSVSSNRTDSPSSQLTVLPLSESKPREPKNTLKRLKRRRPRETPEPNVVVEETSFSPLYVKPISPPPKRSTHTNTADQDAAAQIGDGLQATVASIDSRDLIPNVSKRFQEGSPGRPPGVGIGKATKTTIGSPNLLWSSPGKIQDSTSYNHKTFPSRIPVKVRLKSDIELSRPPMWLPASRYSRMQCRPKSLRRPDEIKSFLIAV